MYGIVSSEKAEATRPTDLAGADDGEPVFVVRHDGLAAIVSRTRRSGYRQMARHEAARCLVAHQRVLEGVMGRSTVLPVRFGTVLPGEAHVRRLLEQAAPVLARALAGLSGSVQTEVVVTWRPEDVFREVASEPEIARAIAEAPRQPPDQAEVARIAVGKMVKAALERRRDELQRWIVPALRAVCTDLAVNSIMDDGMVLNVALLVDQARRDALDDALAQLDRRSEGRLRFRCVGPLPPYSFATVAVEVMEFAPVDRARRLLGLGPRASWPEIRQAYRRLAARRHPDVGAEASEERMAALNDAYGLLAAYTGMSPSDDAGLRGRIVAFDRRAVARRLVVSVDRHVAA